MIIKVFARVCGTRLGIFFILIAAIVGLNLQISLAENTLVPEKTEDTATITLSSTEIPVEKAPEAVISQTFPDRLVIGNDYIAVAVNNSNDATGRFGVKVTGGDPYRTGDEEQPLIYGFEKPWTSYTTIRIDGTDYIFGGHTKKRSGLKGFYGEQVTPPTINNETMAVYTTYRFGAIEVTQEISIVESTTTALCDTAKIKYSIVNKSELPHEIGIRAVIDTMLGQNDGAPFRIAETSILTDTVFKREDLPEFWQAFDTLREPHVIAQGTMKGREATPPDVLYFTNWGNVADSQWDVPLVPNRDFTRAGEFDLDSSAVYLWNPVTVAPLDTKTYVFYYGLGGVTVVPGELQLGVTSPAEISLGETDKTYSIMAYIENTGKGPAVSTRVRLQLPSGLELVGKRPAETIIGNLKPGEMTQVYWEVKPTGKIIGLFQFEIVASAINLPENRVRRSIRVVGPPKLTLRVNPPTPLKVINEKVTPMPYPIEAIIKNSGESVAYGVIGSLQIGQGMKPAPNEIIQKYIGNLKPGEEYKLTWHLIPDGVGIRSYLGVRFESNSTKPVLYIAGIRLPVLTPKIRLLPLQDEVKPGEFLAVEVRAEHFSALHSARFNINYSPKVIDVVRVSRGLFFIEDRSFTPWNPGLIRPETGQVRGVGGERNSPAPTGISLATIHLQLSKKPGEGLLTVDDLSLWSEESSIPVYIVEGLRIKITDKGGVEIVPVKIEK